MGRRGRALSAHHESTFAGAGGVRIYWQSWTPDGGPRAVIVISHGASEHSGRYEHVARRLLADDYAVYAIEHRGHGHSEGPRALIDRLDNAVADLDVLVARVADEQPGIPIFLFGHSVGGTIAILYAARHQDRLTGLILSGPLAALAAASPATRLVSKALSAIAPRLPLIAIDAGTISRDPAVVERYRADPLVHHGKLPARTAAELAAAIEALPASAAAITIPTLIMYGTDDALCPPEGSLMLNGRIGAADKTLRAYDGLYHEILNEPEQEQVLEDVCAWLAARAPVPV